MANLYVVGYRGPSCALYDVTNVSRDSLDYIQQHMDPDEHAKCSSMLKEGWGVPEVFATVTSMKGTIRAQFFMEILALR